MTARLTTAELPLAMLGEHADTISTMLFGAARSLLPAALTGNGNATATKPALTREVDAPSMPLQRAYCRWTSAGSHYRTTLPPHFVSAKVTLPLVSQLTARAPYPLLGVLNQGLRLRLHAPLPSNEKIRLEGRLVDASDDGYRARIHSQVVVGTASTPKAITVDAMAAVLLKKRGENDSANDQSKHRQMAFETVATWQAAADEGRTFFWLTGDFNPIHTWPAFAKRTRFGGCIMHGYGAFAQVFERLVQNGATIADIDVRFVRPLPLPSPLLLIQRSTHADEQGRRAIRLIDNDAVLYQVGHYREAIAP